MRDHNGLGFSIAGGRGAAQFKDGSDVRMADLCVDLMTTPLDFLAYSLLQFIGGGEWGGSFFQILVITTTA